MTLTNFNIKQKKLDTITLTNIKQTLLKFEFEESIVLKCIDDEKIDCFVIIDDVIQEEKVTNLFKYKPDVYEYSKELKDLDFKYLELENMESYQICFEFSIDKYRNSSQLIVDTFEDVFIYDGISKKPTKIKYINDVDSYFEDKIKEVKDAF